jgi:hypothetical protein
VYRCVQQSLHFYLYQWTRLALDGIYGIYHMCICNET